LAFTCPACGLITTFNVEGLSLEQLRTQQGSAWAARLRRYAEGIPESLRYTQRAGARQFTGTLIVAFVTWLLLTGSLNPIDLAWGLAVSFVVAAFAYRFAAPGLSGWVFSPRRWLALGALLVEFARQLVVQNVTLAARVLRPGLPIRPGIVAVPTALVDDVALTLLGSLMTLTPDTVVLDIDQRRGILYVHWIDVKTTDPLEAREMISASLEDKITRWLL
jgi:multicomponent Na+:H+ antiporter subunit E